MLQNDGLGGSLSGYQMYFDVNEGVALARSVFAVDGVQIDRVNYVIRIHTISLSVDTLRFAFAQIIYFGALWYFLNLQIQTVDAGHQTCSIICGVPIETRLGKVFATPCYIRCI